jgi:hypothetical protein
MVKNKLILLSLLFMSACQTTPPGIKTVIQKVEIPVAVPCKEVIPLKPSFYFDKLVPSNDIYGQAQALSADRLLHKGYEEELLAALTACVK